MTTNEEDNTPRILIVEDDERLAMLTQDYLVKNGLEVAIETDGNRAIRRIVSEQPDLVVLDVMLPGSDGLTVCREVRPHYQNPILMLTARTEDMDQVLGLEMGADDYVAKPAQPRVLLARIRALLRRSENAPSEDVPQRLEFRVKISLSVYVVLNMTVKIAQLTFVSHAFVQKSVMIQKIQNVSKPFVVKGICSLKKATKSILLRQRLIAH